MRLFIALNFTNEVKTRICEVIRRMESGAVEGRFVRAEQIHLTLEFLGEVQSGRVSAIRSIMDGLDFNAFTLRPAKVGCFKRRDGRIYWLGVEHSDTLLALQRTLHGGLRENGFAVDERKYSPHITLGRKVVLREVFSVDELTSDLRDITMDITKVDLMKSDFVPGGVKYSVLYSKPLGDKA